MYYVYLLCGVIGGTVIVCQFLMSLIGLGGDHDVGGHDGGGDVGGHDVGGGHDVAGHDVHHGTDHGAGHQAHSTNWLFGMLTFRTVVAALAFFGLAGLAASKRLDPLPALGVAVAAGAAAFFLVGWLMRALYKLNAEGTARIERSVGSPGTVYLPIPGNQGGVGKVLVNLQSRTVEYKAVSKHDQLPTGAKVVVVSVVSSDTVEVAPAAEVERTAQHA